MGFKTKILILGGTGAMGSHLIKILSESANEIYVTTRSERKSYHNTHYIQGNAHDADFLGPILQTGWDAIVDFMVYSTKEFESKVDFLLQATNHYIYLSSARVYADSNKPIVEEFPRLLDTTHDIDYLKTDDYAIAKANQENILIGNKNTNWTIIRPYITYSESRLQLGVLEKEEWLYRALKGRSIVFSKDIASKSTTLTHGFDVARGIASILGNKSTAGQIFNITGNKTILWTDVLQIYLKVLENHLRYKPKVVLCEIDKFNQIHPSKKYQIKYDRLYNRHFDNNKIGEFVNVNSFIDPHIGLANCLDSFIKGIHFKYINWKTTEAYNDKYSKEFASLTEMNGLKQKLKYCLYRFTLDK